MLVVYSPGLRFAGPPSLRLWRKEGVVQVIFYFFLPSFPLAEEKVGEYNEAGVSQNFTLSLKKPTLRIFNYASEH
jgi:hypothetical protein